jgi:D-cysteine desulfhydrase
VESKAFPLYERFPALAALPRASLGAFPSPVERIVLDGGIAVWLKRDDRNAPLAAGNKVRALEFLLGRVGPGDLVLTAGAEGSTHVYATAVHAERLGGRVAAVQWPQEMHPVAAAVAREAERRCVSIARAASVATGLLRAAAWRLRWPSSADGREYYVPIGGSSPLGILGNVNAGLELAAQIEAGVLPAPAQVVVPLGSGGTAAGLALGLGIGGVPTTVVAARVAPRGVANALRVRMLIDRTRRLIRRAGRVGMPLPAVPVAVDHSVYGGAYGRPLAVGASAAALFQRAAARAGLAPITLDPTYGAKAAAVALAWATGGERRSGDVLLWVTFDGRALVTTDAGAGGLGREGR